MVPCPVEVCVQFTPINAEEVRVKLKTSKYLSRGQAQKQCPDMRKSRKSTREVLGDSRALQDYLDETEHPMFKTTITICTWGETPEQVISIEKRLQKR